MSSIPILRVPGFSPEQCSRLSSMPAGGNAKNMPMAVNVTKRGLGLAVTPAETGAHTALSDPGKRNVMLKTWTTTYTSTFAGGSLPRTGNAGSAGGKTGFLSS